MRIEHLQANVCHPGACPQGCTRCCEAELQSKGRLEKCDDPDIQRVIYRQMCLPWYSCSRSEVSSWVENLSNCCALPYLQKGSTALAVHPQDLAPPKFKGLTAGMVSLVARADLTIQQGFEVRPELPEAWLVDTFMLKSPSERQGRLRQHG